MEPFAERVTRAGLGEHGALSAAPTSRTISVSREC